LVIVATSTSEHIFPSTASQVQDWLGASRAGALDVSAACAGFVYALDMAAAKIRAGDIDTALVIGAETMSRVLNWSDRGTCILFGDGAGAVLLVGSNNPGGVLSSVLRSDGSGGHVLGLPTVGSRDSLQQEHREREVGYSTRPIRRMHRLHMNGREVFRFATRVITESIRETLKLANLETDELDLVIPHQANYRIIEAAARALKIPLERFYSNVDRYGNTSAASIPIALCEAIAEGRLQQGDHLVMCGFGGGLAWATIAIQWETIPVERYSRLMAARQQVTYWYAVQRRRIVRLWRRWSNRLGRSPTPDATMRQLRKRLKERDIEHQKGDEDT
ncbi:MAG: ketoacyl-ACP synthase III, partial [Chloroflexi bacterium]|nr:ketoacyl-ACP synthase III [Chloroflexota bacterium]